MSVDRPYAGKTADERRLGRRAALQAAAFELLGTEGRQALTVRAVFTKAGLHQRYFYESFTDIDDLLVSVFDEVMTDVVNRTTGALPTDGEISAAIRAMVEAFVSTLDEPRARRIALVEAWGSEALMRRRAEYLHMGAQVLTEAVKSGLPSAAEDGAVELAAFSIVGGLLEAMLAWTDGHIAMTTEQFIDRFTRLASATMHAALG